MLILGSLPGPRSLQKHEYYAHPQNAFWPIMASLCGPLPDSYTERTLALSRAGVAVWDVLAAAPRIGALDSSIERQRALPNDFTAFFQMHPRIALVCFNGSESERLYRRLVLPLLTEDLAAIATQLLPSTSPARAIPFELKRNAWATALAPWVAAGG